MFQEKAARNRAEKEEQELLERARKFLSEEDITIFTSPWGMSRLQQLVYEHNKEASSPFEEVHTASFKAIVEIYELEYENFNNDIGIPLAYTAAKASRNKRIPNQVIREARGKTAEELAQPVPRTVYETPEEFKGNPAWIQLQDEFAAYNETTDDYEAQIHVYNFDDLIALHRLADLIDKDAKEATPLFRKASAASEIIERVLKEHTPPESKADNVVQLFPR